MPTIKLKLAKKIDTSYDIIVENGLMSKIPQILKEKKFANKYTIIADSNVAKLYGTKFISELNSAGLKAELIKFPAGEKFKTLATAEKIMAAMLKAGFDRTDGIVALGGGVTGDLSGFIASVYMRGIALIHIPTTLLAMVDSSIGGKTGVDLTAGKNLCGIFYQPKAVYMDPKLLASLQNSELINGFAEVIKYSIIKDYKLFCLLESSVVKLLKADLSILNKIIIRCCEIKASIIAKDEHEKNLRMLLNYGHTIGHAIESISAYKIKHGTAIAMGMKFINKISLAKRLLNNNTAERINLLFNSFGLTENLSQMYMQKKGCEKLWSIMQNDKKMRAGKISFIITKEIGKAVIYDEITKADFMKACTL